MNGRARFVALVEVNIPDEDPDQPPSTQLTFEEFDQGTDGFVPSTLNLNGATAVTGSGSLLFTDSWAIVGDLGLSVDGTAQHFITYGTYASHSDHQWSVYFRLTRLPSANAWVGEVRDGSNATAFQWGVDSAGHIILRNAGTGAVDATSTTVLQIGKTYRGDIDLGNLVGRFALFTDPNLSNTTPPVEVVQCTITATTFTNELLGLLEAISGTGGVTGNLQNDTYDNGGTNGTAITAANVGTITTADVSSGSAAALTLSSAQQQDGTLSLHVQAAGGAGYHSLRYNNASHNKHLATFFVRPVQTPGSNVWLYEIRDGGGTVQSVQFGVGSDAKFGIRDNLGTRVAAAGTYSLNTWYRVDIAADPSQATAANRLRCWVYTGGNLLSTNTANATWTINTTTLTATSFSNELVGVIANFSTGTVECYIDGFRSDSTTQPVGTTAVGIGIIIGRSVSDSTIMPAPLPGLGQDPDPVPGEFSPKLEPSVGVLVGATTGTVGTQGGSSESGLATYVGDVGHRPHILHYYKTGAWNGQPTTAERRMAEPVGGTAADRAIFYWTWKPASSSGTSLTFQQIAQGAADAQIRIVAQGLMAYGHTQMLGIFHEPEDNVGSGGMTAAWYVAMFRRVVEVMRAEGVRDRHCVFVWNMMGYSGWADSPTFDALYPGDDVVDWIAWDPYFETGRTGLDLNTGLLNENVASVAGWDGFYTWATTARTGFTGTKPLMLAEWATDFRDFTDSQAAARINQVTDGIDQYPRLKALVWWNSTVPAADKIDGQMHGHTAAIAAYKALVESNFAQQNMGAAP